MGKTSLHWFVGLTYKEIYWMGLNEPCLIAYYLFKKGFKQSGKHYEEPFKPTIQNKYKQNPNVSQHK